MKMNLGSSRIYEPYDLSGPRLSEKVDVLLEESVEAADESEG